MSEKLTMCRGYIEQRVSWISAGEGLGRWLCSECGWDGASHEATRHADVRRTLTPEQRND